MSSSPITYESVIGLEVHIQLNTCSKAFSSEANVFELSPNLNISAVTLGLPGTLPRANKEHVEKSLHLALALGCDIPQQTRFDRKNYFYPDLPKGYQITQDKNPIGKGGSWTFTTGDVERTIRIHHIHMEEDAGKSNHELSSIQSLIEYNRAGTPLVELVTEPDFRTGQEVYDFLTSLQQLVQYLGISDGNMEEGSIRCDCNVSIRPAGSPILGERCEIKNVNSRRFAREAIAYEAKRQEEVLTAGSIIERTTLLFDSEKGTTHPMRKKEGENDYRYFPEPDLSPIQIDDNWVQRIKAELSILPSEAMAKLIGWGVPKEDAEKISSNKQWYLYFAELVQDHALPATALSSMVVNKLLPYAENQNMELSAVLSPIQIEEVITLYNSGKVGKSDVFSVLLPALMQSPQNNVEELAQALNLVISVEASDLLPLIEKVLMQNPDKVKEYQNGKKGLLGFFMGQVKQSAGLALDVGTLKSLLEEALNKSPSKN
ncbi:MAG: Asp-tRNA(Asn)/Glu-tRNA(Gln) amidotransferase subunit GatB [Saprospiraceae bacterium]|nr:Asp-tRNA(Asn)/Glu-tRNA(Gln) amidotransferase subunit GatB [Saprospiraceae bacterium]